MTQYLCNCIASDLGDEFDLELALSLYNVPCFDLLQWGCLPDRETGQD